MEIKDVAPYNRPAIQAPSHYQVCAEFTGTMYIHMVSTLEQRVINGNLAYIRKTIPNAQIKLVTYDDHTHLSVGEKLKEIFTDIEKDHIHLIVTSGIMRADDRKFSSYELTIAFKQFGLKHYDANYHNLNGTEIISMTLANAIRA